MQGKSRAIGAELLVYRRFAVKLGAGRYEPTPEGVLVRSRLKQTALSFATRWGEPKTLRIDRAAVRPGPRQLLRFDVLHWSLGLASRERGLIVFDLAVSALRWLKGLGLDVEIRQSEQHRISLETDHPDALRHSLATVVSSKEERVELSIGIDCVLVAILAQGIWPAELGRVLPCYVGRRAREHRELCALRDLAASKKILVDLRSVALLGSTVHAPCILVSRGGWTVLTEDARYRSSGPAEALERWQACL